MKKINLMLRKCKSLSMQLRRSSSYSSLRSTSTRERFWSSTGHHHHKVHEQENQENQDCDQETIYVGSTRKRYVVNSKFLSHPLLKALIEKPRSGGSGCGGGEEMILVKCEVVLFDHLLWMLENADLNHLNSESLDELAQLYVF